jgi:hypothetical protein
MRKLSFLVMGGAVVVASVIAAACSDDSEATTTASGTGASGATGGADGGGGSGASGGATSAGGTGGGGMGTGGTVPNSGDCDGDDDCPGGTCVELAPGGFRVCVFPPMAATACTGSQLDECCTTDECTEGICYEAPLTPYCGGPAMQPHNECGVDQCDKNADCMMGNVGGVCVPAGALEFKVAACMYAACKHDTDCTDEPGAICAVVSDPCCNNAAGLYCVYPSDGCRTAADCPGGYCTTDTEKSFCMTGVPRCPL